MPVSPNSLIECFLDPEDFFRYCSEATLTRQRLLPPLASIETANLLWAFTRSLAHAIEVASRVFGALGPVYPPNMGKQVEALLLSPTSELLYELWGQWRVQHPECDATQTMQVPLHFMHCQTAQFRYLREITMRSRLLPFPVMKAWVSSILNPVDAVTASKSSGEKVSSSKAIFDAMDHALKDTVGRSLYPDREQPEWIASYPIEDREQDAIAGAIEANRRGEAGILALMRNAGRIVTIKGKKVQVPAIPPLPVFGMQSAEGMNAVWRAAAIDQAIQVLAKTAPGVLGILETALPDAAHAELRSVYQRAAAKKRGGLGVNRQPHADQTPKSSEDPVPMWNSFEGGILKEQPRDDRENPQQQLESQQDEVRAFEVAKRAMQIARKRWGKSGERMLQSLVAGQSRKTVAQAAGVVPSAIDKRLKALRQALSD